MCTRTVVTFIVHSSLDLSALAFMIEDEAVQIIAVQVLNIVKGTDYALWILQNLMMTLVRICKICLCIVNPELQKNKCVFDADCHIRTFLINLKSFSIGCGNCVILSMTWHSIHVPFPLYLEHLWSEVDICVHAKTVDTRLFSSHPTRRLGYEANMYITYLVLILQIEKWHCLLD